MEESTLINELQKFNVTDAAIAKMSADYMGLTINGLDDKEGFNVVHKARMDVKNRRIEVTKIGKELREDAIKYQKTVIAEEKRIVGLLAPIEDHLAGEENKIEAEKARIKAEAEAKESARIQARVDRICSFGAIFNGQTYKAYQQEIPVSAVKILSDVDFEIFIGKIERAKEAEEEAIAKIKAEQEAESERLKKIREEQEAEAKRLAEISRQQAEEAARIKAEQEEAVRKLREEQEAIEREKKRMADEEAARLKAAEDEKRRVEEEKQRAVELEKAKVAAAERAKKEAEEKAKREAEEKAETERLAKIEAERQEALRPDKEKLMAFADLVESLTSPKMNDTTAQTIVDNAKTKLTRMADSIRKEARSL
jgi:DNA repair exonuclease SbcCD ATPase subunit